MTCIDPKAVKLLSLALDPAALPGEIEASALKFVRFCREQKYSTADVVGGTSLAKRERITFPFGKYRGWPLDEVPTDYVDWASANLTRLAPAFRLRLHTERQRRRQS